MDWGLSNRIHRMFLPSSGNTVMLAVDTATSWDRPGASRTLE